MMKSVYVARDAVRAELIRGLLMDAGIQVVVAGGFDVAIGGMGHVTPRILVDEADAARAAEIIRASGVDVAHECPQCGYDVTGLPEARCPECGTAFPRREPEPSWKCAACGESIEGHFTQCWNCGGARPEPAAAE